MTQPPVSPFTKGELHKMLLISTLCFAKSKAPPSVNSGHAFLEAPHCEHYCRAQCIYQVYYCLLQGLGEKPSSLGEDFSLTADLARQKVAKAEGRKVLQTYLKNYCLVPGFYPGLSCLSPLGLLKKIIINLRLSASKGI